jgi:hypothetical protein
MAKNVIESRFFRGRRLKAIEAVISARNLRAAARAAGISARTLARWMQDPAFRHAVIDGARQVHGAALRRLQGTAREAVERLRRLMRSGKEEIALGACRTVLQGAASAADLIDGMDTQQRLDEIERRITKEASNEKPGTKTDSKAC